MLPENLQKASGWIVCFPNSEEAWPSFDFLQHLLVLGGWWGWKRPDPFIAGKPGRGLSDVWKGRELTAQYSQIHAAGEQAGKETGCMKTTSLQAGSSRREVAPPQHQAEENIPYFWVNHKSRAAED